MRMKRSCELTPHLPPRIPSQVGLSVRGWIRFSDAELRLKCDPQMLLWMLLLLVRLLLLSLTLAIGAIAQWVFLINI